MADAFSGSTWIRTSASSIRDSIASRRLVRERVGALEGGALLELDVHVDVAVAARDPGAELVVARHLGGPGLGDRGLDPVHLLGRRRLVDQDPAALRMMLTPVKTMNAESAIAIAASSSSAPVSSTRARATEHAERA